MNTHPTYQQIKDLRTNGGSFSCRQAETGSGDIQVVARLETFGIVDKEKLEQQCLADSVTLGRSSPDTFVIIGPADAVCHAIRLSQ